MRRLALVLFVLASLARAADAADPLARLRPGHPRLLFTDDQLAAAIAAEKSDPLRAQLHARIVAAAEAELRTTPVEHVLIGPRLLDKSRTCLARVLTCGLAYRLRGDERFFERAKRELLATAAFPDWNPSHFLDVAEMSLAFAIGYDWLFARFTADERATLKAAMLKHALAFAPAAYGSGGATDRRVGRWVNAAHNWNQVCNGGMLAAALALADEEPDLARLVIRGARESLPRAMHSYQPDGAYPEGPAYWSYGTSYNVIAIAALESALGTDLGLADAAAFDRTVHYRLHIQSPTGLAFNHADGSASLPAHPEYSWLARRYRVPAALAHSRDLLRATLAEKRTNNRLFALHAAWFPEAPADAAEAPLDVHFRGPAQLAIFRSAWRDPDALFIGFKAGRNDVNHAHLDLGSFVLDADGVRWAHDLGPDDYNLPGYFGAKRWTYYRLINTSHNTLTPGDALQDSKAEAPIVAFKSTPARAFAIADLSAAYPGVAQHHRRGIALLDRARVLVQDDLAGVAAGTTLTWRMMTHARVRIVDGRHAVLSENGKTLRAEILAPREAHFSAMPATPPAAAERQNEGFTVLTARIAADAADVRVAILLTPAGEHWPASQPAPALEPLAAW